MENKLQQILVVEDNYEFFENAAISFCIPGTPIAVFANDYEQAEYYLKMQEFVGAIIDCFFPEKAGSERRELGKQALEKMASCDPKEQLAKAYAEEFAKYVNLEGKLGTYVRRFALSSTDVGKPKNPSQSPIVRSIERCYGALGREAATHILKNTLGAAYKTEGPYIKDNFLELEKAMQADPSNQPLGILIAEQAESLGIPFVLATSVNHHDSLIQPVYSYVRAKGWTICDDTYGNKSEPRFWERTYKTLEGKMGGTE